MMIVELPKKILISLYMILALLICSILLIPTLILIYPFIEQKTFTYIGEYIGSIILRLMTISGIWTFNIINLSNINFRKRGQQYILIANHASYIDTLIMWQIPLCKRFMMAEKFAKIPVFGWICRVSGHILVDKFNPNTTVGAVDKAAKTLEDGSSFVIFPEGMRSPDPYELLPFKTGAFRLAQKTGIPILPIVLRGTGEAMAVNDICNSASLEMIIGEPIHIPSDENLNKSIKGVRKFIEFYL